MKTLNEYLTHSMSPKRAFVREWVETHSTLETVALTLGFHLPDRTTLEPVRVPCVPPSVEIVARVTSTCIRLIENPKTRAKTKDGECRQAGEPRTLTRGDCEEVLSTVAITLARNGGIEIFERTRELPRDFWKECFRTSRQVLGLNNGRDKRFDPATLAAKGSGQYVRRRDKDAIRRRYNYTRDCIIAAFNADTSRKRVSKMQKMVSLLETAFEYMRGDSGFSSLPDSCIEAIWGNQYEEDKNGNPIFGSVSKANRVSRNARLALKRDFLAYVSQGERELNR